MKYVQDSAAGKQISAWIVLKKGKRVATVRMHHGNGKCTVNIFSNSETQGFQYSSASGYGMDLRADTMAGLFIDAVQLYGHCQTDEKTEAMLKRYRREALKLTPTFKHANAVAFRIKWGTKAKKQGMHFANWRDGAFQSLYYISGLERLDALGYTVIRAI